MTCPRNIFIMADVGIRRSHFAFRTTCVALQTKRRFERDSKEAERAQHMCDRMDVDNNVDAEKVATKHHTLCSLAVLAHEFATYHA